jgi:Rrf2 family transcriptional regulator, cysteine metabolism repressor
MTSLLGISQKCQYALRALFELSHRYSSGAVASVADIATVQGIPPRFLEQIFSKLKNGGYILSQRGNRGGYILAKQPSDVTIGEIIRFIDGSEDPIQCLNTPSGCKCQYPGSCVFKDLWQQAGDATTKIFDSTTFQNLIDQQNTINKTPDFTI